jgi:hypothetical protein
MQVIIKCTKENCVNKNVEIELDIVEGSAVICGPCGTVIIEPPVE